MDGMAAGQDAQACASVVMVRNVFNHADGREVIPVSGSPTIREYLDAQGIDEFTQPTLCLVNGEAQMRAAWPLRRIGPGDVCTFMALPHGGGGGGGGGKNALAMVAMVAIMVSAPYLGAMGSMAFTGGIGSMGAFTTAIQGFAVSGLISTALTPPKPSTPSLNYGGVGGGNTQAPSPTYSLQAQGNTARLGQPIPVGYGRNKMVLDLAATSYTEYVDNEEFLHQLHAVGQGEYDVEVKRIEDTPITSFEEVQTETVPPGGSVTLFDPDVVTAPEVAGQELLSTGDGGAAVGAFAANPVDTEAESLGVDAFFPRGIYYSTTSGLTSKTVQWKTEARQIDENGDPVGAGTWAILGAHIAATDISAAASDDSFNSTTTDFVAEGVKVGQLVTTEGFSNGANNGTFEVTAVTANKVTVATALADEAAGSSVTVEAAGETVTMATNTPQRISYKYAVTAGRYEVRGERLDIKDTSAQAGHELRWGQLRAYLNTVLNFGDVTLLAVKMRATNNLSNQSSRMINIIATRKLPTWSSAGGWTAATATQSIAWAFADAARAKYGGKLEDARIDLAALETLDAVWDARGDTFNGVFDSAGTVWDALTKIARAGRAQPYQQAGIVRIWRDGVQTLPVAMFGPRNIVKNSLSIEYVLPSEDTADSVTVEFWNERTWKPDEVTGAYPHIQATDISAAAADNSFNSTTTNFIELGVEAGADITVDGFSNAANNANDAEDGDVFTVVSVTSTKVVVSGGTLVDEAAGAGVTVKSPCLNPAKVTLFGVTDAAQALREADAMAAANVLRRKIVKFRTELEGMIPTYGDLASVTHDLPRWGLGGEVLEWDAANSILTLSEPPEWEAGATHYIVLRAQDGSPGTGALEVEAVTGGTAHQVHVIDSLSGFVPYTGSDEERTHFSFGPGVPWGQLCLVRGMRPRGMQVEMTMAADNALVHVN